MDDEIDRKIDVAPCNFYWFRIDTKHMTEPWLGQTLLMESAYKCDSGNKNKGKGNGAGLAWESQSHCFADEFPLTHAHSFGTAHKHDVSAPWCDLGSND